jgi:hypothetical protein
MIVVVVLRVVETVVVGVEEAAYSDFYLSYSDLCEDPKVYY